MGAQQADGLSSPTEPSCTVSALTGFDPSRRDNPLSWTEDAFSAGNRYTAENGWKVERSYDGRKNYYTVLDADGCETRDFRKFDHAILFAEYASAIEARSDETRSGSAEGESAAPSGETPNA